MNWLKNEELCDFITGVPECVTQHSPGIYSFEIFKPEINKLWIEEIENIKEFLNTNILPMEQPNPENNHGIILDDFGFKHILESLIKKIISPIAKHLWSGVGEDSLELGHAFTVAYSAKMDKNLSLHEDNSELTVNYCMGPDDFKGSRVKFKGVRCRAHGTVKKFIKKEEYWYTNVPGRAVIHMGRHYHRAENVKSGSRQNIIIFC